MRRKRNRTMRRRKWKGEVVAAYLYSIRDRGTTFDCYLKIKLRVFNITFTANSSDKF
jgi:hypothetical protein